MKLTNAAPSVARTGLKAGVVFLGTMAFGLALSVLLSGGVTWLYWGQFLTGTGVATARAGGLGALLTLVFMPEYLVALLLPLFVLVYGALSFFYAWRRALQRVVEVHSGVIADRLAEVVSHRLATMPRTQESLLRAGKWLSEDSVSQTLESSSLGGRRWARRVARFAIGCLPWSDLLADWATGEATQAEGDAFRSTLAARITAALREAAAPSWWPLVLCLVAHGALFGLGAWLAS
ncbi:MAG: hypothetical protein LBQ81_12500 [Zoogloeaceae bacterium]|jgi:hypothetical protein|nr:hypothetical protein [Zoogloeaceae bacterium]